jgi:3-phenylpropionate/cinnamic acid dioxygenase small subunit
MRERRKGGNEKEKISKKFNFLLFHSRKKRRKSYFRERKILQ